MALPDQISLLMLVTLSKTLQGIIKISLSLIILKDPLILQLPIILETGLMVMALTTQEIGPMAMKLIILEIGHMEILLATPETLIILKKVNTTSKSKELKLTSNIVKKIMERA
jgi:hypothetical protein